MSSRMLSYKFSWVPWTILLLACIYFGAMLKAELIFLCLAIFISLIYSITYSSNASGAPILLLYILVFQNLAIGLGAHLSGNESENLSLLTQVPFVLSCTLFIFLLKDHLSTPLINKDNKWFCILSMWIVIMFFVGGGAISAKLVNLRNLTIFFMAFCIAKKSLRDRFSKEFFYKQFGVLCIFVSIFGLFLLSKGIDFWLDLGLKEVYIAKQAPLSIFTEWNGRFTTTIDGVHPLTRMLSVYYEPVNLAYLFVAGLICVAITWKNSLEKFIALVILAIGLFYTFGKGGWVILGAYILFSILRKLFLPNKVSQTDLAKLLIIIVGVVASILILYYLFIGGAVRPHFEAVINTWKNVLNSPIGHGLGSGGNAASALGSLSGSWLDSGEESALMSFAYQIGIPGVFLLLQTFRTISLSNPSIISTHKGATLFSIPLILFCVSILQDNTFSPQCIIPFMLVMGSFSNEQVLHEIN